MANSRATNDGLLTTPLVYYLGTDHSWEFTVYTSNARTVCRDVTGYTTSFMVKSTIDDADGAALLTLEGDVAGNFTAAPHTNNQRITVTVSSDDTDTEISPQTAFWELKRTDAGFEEILAKGDISLRRAVHRS